MFKFLLIFLFPIFVLAQSIDLGDNIGNELFVCVSPLSCAGSSISILPYYLPLTGGTMTGNILFNNNNNMGLQWVDGGNIIENDPTSTLNIQDAEVTIQGSGNSLNANNSIFTFNSNASSVILDDGAANLTADGTIAGDSGILYSDGDTFVDAGGNLFSDFNAIEMIDSHGQFYYPTGNLFVDSAGDILSPAGQTYFDSGGDLSVPGTLLVNGTSIFNSSISLGSMTAHTALVLNSAKTVVGVVPGTTGNLMQSNGTDWVSTAYPLPTAAAPYVLPMSTGTITAVLSAGAIIGSGKARNNVTLVSATLAASVFTCSVNPVFTLLDCGVSGGACTSSPTTLMTVTLTAANTLTAGTINSSSLVAGHFWTWKIASGTCTALTAVGTAEASATLQ